MYLTRDYGFKLKSLADDSGRFEGLASPTGPPADEGGDVIAPGAFAQSVALQPEYGYPLLVEHSSDKLVGSVRIEERSEGLWARGEVDRGDELGRRIYSKLQKRLLRGLSIGYLPVQGMTEHRSDGTRLLKSLRLFEISLTCLPMAPRAQVASVKSLSAARRLLTGLSADELTSDLLAELKSIDHYLAGLLAKHEPAPKADDGLLAELQSLAGDLARYA